MKFGARHLRRALSNEHLDPALGCAMTPRKLEAHAMRQVDALGVTLQIKRRSAIDPSRALAGPGKIYLPRSFKKAATRNRAGLLLHELVHVRQWRKEGTLRMAARYAFAPRWRERRHLPMLAYTDVPFSSVSSILFSFPYKYIWRRLPCKSNGARSSLRLRTWATAWS